MISIEYNLATKTARIPATTIVRGADVPVQVTFSEAPGSLSGLQLALGSQANAPEVLAFTELFESENATTWIALLDASDTRLATFMGGGGAITVDAELVATIDGERLVAPHMSVTVQPPIIDGPETSATGPVLSRWLPGLTGLTGGGAAKLDGVDITAFPDGSSVRFKIGNEWYSYRVADAGALPAESSPAFILPDVADGTKYWALDYSAVDGDGDGVESTIFFTGRTMYGVFVGSFDASMLQVQGTSLLRGAVTVENKLAIFKSTLATGTLAVDGHLFSLNIATIAGTSTGTISRSAAVALQPSTLTSTLATTITNAATLYIPGAPIAGANVTITNAFALLISGGLGIDRLVVSQTALAYAATTNIDLLGGNVRTLSLTGNVTFTTSNRAAGREVSLRITCDGTARNLTFPAWKFVGGAAPNSIAANKVAILTLLAFGTADTDIVAAYAVQP